MENRESQNQLESLILETLIYAKIEKRPLYLVEISFYLNAQKNRQKFSFSELKKALEPLLKKDLVRENKGLYEINTGKNFDFKNYLERSKEAQKKIYSVQKKIFFLKRIPFLKTLFLCGSVAKINCSPRSDIDFLIITEAKKVWTVRFLLTFLSWILGAKTVEGQSRKNKFCLNHYRSLSRLKLEKNLRDFYSAKEYSRMINLFSRSRNNLFLEKNRHWMKNFLSQYTFKKPPLAYHPRKNSKIIPGFDYLLKIVEKTLQKLQLMKMENGKNRSTDPLKLDKERIVLENNVIMFHLSPRAPRILDEFQALKNKFIESKTNGKYVRKSN